MKNRNVEQEEALFDAARRLPDEGKTRAFLDFACGDDADLRRRIDELLTAHAESETLFGSVAVLDRGKRVGSPFDAEVGESVARQDESVYSETIGARIGRYRLVEKLGEGGCGVVYLAEQVEPVLRKVALKIIRFGMETRSVIQRFEAERQTLAMMDHPNIAHVFDAGETVDGSPYFVMEYVQGERITTYCDQQRLSLRERLDMFIDISHAIQHAHQKGIVHGDIKPSNIMVAMHDGTPLPKVIDFGISRVTDARLTESISLISYAQLAGTPAYMSPEQVEMEMDVDTRSDIYSLGVLLFELLTGSTPFKAGEPTLASAERLRNALREHRPEPPSTKLLALPQADREKIARSRGISPARLIATVRGDLDAIVMKALEKDRRNRYDTVNGLALEIERFLNHEPVMARPTGWGYRLWKLVRRNRGVFVGVGAVALVLVAGVTVSTRLYLQEREARDRAVAAERQEAQLRRQAEVREQLTQAALLISHEDFPEADRLLEQVASPPPTLETAAVFRAVGEWHAIHGRWEEAAESFSVLVRVNLVNHVDVSTLDYLELGPALIELGDADAYDRFRGEAIERFRESRPFGDRIMKVCLLAPADEDVIDALLPFYRGAQLAIAEAEAADDAFQAAWQALSLALFDYRRGEFAEADAWVERCLRYEDENAPRTATAQAIRAMALASMGRVDEAHGILHSAESALDLHASALGELGSPASGFWFDWAFARILIREAGGVLAEES